MLSEQILAKNLDSLKRRNSELAQRLASAAPRENCEILPTRSGHVTARIAAANGNTITLHSAYDPAREAKTFVDSRIVGERETHLLMGFGLGYIAEEMLARLGKRHRLIIVEADISLLRTALSMRDLSGLLSSEKIILWAGDDLARMSAFMTGFFDKSYIEDLTVIKHPPSLLLNGAFYTDAEIEVRNAANKRVVDLHTALALGPKCQGNILLNSIQYLTHPGIGAMLNAFSGKPAIVVAAGPSLDKNVHLLAEAQGKTVIVCVGTVLRKLLAAGVRPNVVVTIDPDEKNCKYFEGLGPVDDIVLAADPESCPGIFGDYPGPKLVIGVDTPETRWLDTFAPMKSVLPKGRSVGHTAFYLARYTGADPIILAGLDLCFPGGRAHAEGCNLSWGDELDVRTEPGLVLVEGIDGRMHPARKNFLNFLTIFENEFAQTRARVIDATEGGARKRGAEVMTLRKALDMFCAAPVDAAPLLRAARETPTADLATFAAEVEAACRNIDSVIETCAQAEKIVKRLKNEIEKTGANSPTVKKLTNRLNDCHQELFRFPHLVPIIQRNMLETRLYMERRDVALIPDMPFGKERLLKEAERGKVFFDGTLQSAASLKPAFAQLRDRVRQSAASKK
jgi:hypothetical protein